MNTASTFQYCQKLLMHVLLQRLSSLVNAYQQPDGLVEMASELARSEPRWLH